GRVLRRALVNLIENALQAMEGSGVLSVSLQAKQDGPRRWAEMAVCDTGPGMDEATRIRIFEPYFSTRDSGIGLGLAVARRAGEEHGGTLSAESAPGKGTRMIIRLPLTSGDAEGRGVVEAAPQAMSESVTRDEASSPGRTTARAGDTPGDKGA